MSLRQRMDEREQGSVQRMMDITRATLYFAKAAILVEGISESLLLPILARRLGHDLAKRHITVIPICGVAFETFRKLLDPAVLGIPVAIVTDADPPLPTNVAWKDATPESDNGRFRLSQRTSKLLRAFANHDTVKVFHAALTLEYDLAYAGNENATVMAEAWQDCFDGTPRTFNTALLTAAGTDRRARAIAAWRGICLAQHSGSKAELAHRLAARLAIPPGSKDFVASFHLPDYLQNAVEYVVAQLGPVPIPIGSTPLC